MLVGVERVLIAASDLDAAVADYAALLGLRPGLLPGRTERTATFAFDNARLELRASKQADEGLFGLVFGREGREPALAAPRGLFLDAQPPLPCPRCPAASSEVHALDHIVIDTDAPDAAIATYRDALGIRLALDRVFPERGVRLLFFRLGGVTLEFAVRASQADAALTQTVQAATAPGRDRFFGLAYRVVDAEAARERLARAGFDVSAVRDGHKPGTRVFSVRDRTHGVPTLMLSDAARARP